MIHRSIVPFHQCLMQLSSQMFLHLAGKQFQNFIEKAT